MMKKALLWRVTYSSSPEDSALDENNTTTVNEDPLPEENQIASGSESPCRAKSETQSSSESLKEETLRASLNAEKVSLPLMSYLFLTSFISQTFAYLVYFAGVY
ncbi:hypothetical protein Avbf_11190 [Armadillidium vulgare]|nr:hypothetical protein Avbf_11190 [Armadillidium vulgare]